MEKKFKTIRIFILSVIFVLFQVNMVLAHGGEDHSHEEEKPAAAVTKVENTGSKLFSSDKVEALVKYPELHTNTAASFQVFITEFQTNKPVNGASVSMYFESADSNITPVKVQGSETSTPGIYQASVTFEKNSNYRMLMGISKGAIDESFSIEAMAVENLALAESTGTGTDFLKGNWLLPALLVLLALLLITTIYLFFRKPGSQTIKDIA